VLSEGRGRGRRHHKRGKVPIAAIVCEIATQAVTGTTSQVIYNTIFSRLTLSSGSSLCTNRFSLRRKIIFFNIPFDSMDPQPTIKKMPANTAAGIVCKTISRGRVIVPIMARPMRKCEIRCSTTAVAFMVGRRIEASSEDVVWIMCRSVS
jgi:hypothetical protein